MKNNIKKYFINVLLISIFIYIFIYSKNIKYYVLFGINLWVNNLIPSIFPFLLISKLLIIYDTFSFINNINIISKIFNTSKNSIFVIISSIFTGFPTGSIYINDLLNKKLINEKEANHLIMFTNYANPLFIISVIGENLLNNKKIGIFILTIHIITGLFVGIIFRNKDIKIYNIKKTKDNNIIQNNFITNLINSIYDSFKVLINMLGIIIFFLMVISLIDTFLNNNYMSLIIKGLIEMTTGITFISKSNLNIRLKVSIICFLLSFSGLSIHFQTKNIIENTNISYKKYLIGRIVHSILCFLVSFLLFNLFFNL